MVACGESYAARWSRWPIKDGGRRRAIFRRPAGPFVEAGAMREIQEGVSIHVDGARYFDGAGALFLREYIGVTGECGRGAETNK